MPSSAANRCSSSISGVLAGSGSRVSPPTSNRRIGGRGVHTPSTCRMSSALARALGNQPVDRADDAQLDVDALRGAGVGGALMALLGLAHGMEDLHGRNSE